MIRRVITSSAPVALLVAAASCQGGHDETTLGAPRSATAQNAPVSLEAPPLDCDHAEAYDIHGVHGANFNTLSVDTSILPLSAVGKVLANDQIHMLRMAAEMGLDIENKHVPAFVVFDGTGNVVSVESGGFYQCATERDCRTYLEDVVGTYTTDGVRFEDRPEFHHSFVGHSYEDLGAAAFAPVGADYAIKITRWSVPASAGDPRLLLEQQWRQHTRAAACGRGTLAQAHLLWSETERVAAEVTIGEIVQPASGDPTPYFVETLGALASQEVLDPLFDDLGWSRIPPAVTDTYLVLTYWPSWFGPSRWPNSASTTAGGPLPEPFCGDGSCNTTVTHEEDPTTCPEDCAPGCGDGVCEQDETADTCAIDCPP